MFDYERLEPVELKGKSGAGASVGGRWRRGRGSGVDLTRAHGRRSSAAARARRAHGDASTERSRAARSSSSRSSASRGSARAGSCTELVRLRRPSGPSLVRWRQGRCLPYGEGIAFWALGRDRQGARRDPRVRRRRRWRAAKLERALPEDAQERAWLGAAPAAARPSRPSRRRRRSRSRPGGASSSRSRRARRGAGLRGPALGRRQRCSRSSTISPTRRGRAALLVSCTARPEFYERARTGRPGCATRPRSASPRSRTTETARARLGLA